MNRKMTDLALAGMGGGFGASGFDFESAAYNMEEYASAPKPQKASQRNSRRFRVQRTCSGILATPRKGTDSNSGLRARTPSGVDRAETRAPADAPSPLGHAR